MLQRFGAASRIESDQLTTNEPLTGLDVTVSIAPRIRPKPAPEPRRPNVRAAALLRTEPARPRKLGQFMIGSTDAPTTQRFFTNCPGFKVSDEVRDTATLMRCSMDHDNVVVSPAPVNYLHHTSRKVADIDEITDDQL